ncbi:MAG: ROK family protein [Acidimicrobiia bacterium]|nr:ROK family protein [Acidimicrobiia bacterium]
MAAPVVAGIDVGGTKILGVAYRLGERPEPLAEERVATPSGDEAILEAILAVIDTVTAERPVDGVGVGAPGLVDRDGILHVGPNLRDIAAVPVRARLAQNLDVPVTVENDATCATWAEHEYGAASVDDALVVTLGTGIGAGIVSGGALQRGTNGFAGEAGHMVVDPSGPPCPCGRRGCWERYAFGGRAGTPRP